MDSDMSFWCIISYVILLIPMFNENRIELYFNVLLIFFFYFVG